MDGFAKEKEKQIKRISYSINLLASLVTITVGILNMDTFALGAIGFIVWAISPYLFAVFMTKRSTHPAAILIAIGVSFILAIAGIFLLIDAMYIHLDAQSALVFVVIPMYQWIILLVTALPLYFINKK